MTALEELKEYVYIDINKHVPALRRLVFIKNGENPVRDISLLRLSINQIRSILDRRVITHNKIKVGNIYKLHGDKLEVEVVNSTNDNMFWVNFSTVKNNEFIGFLNIRYLEVLLENFI